MLAKVLAGTNLGLLSKLITIEVDVASMGLPSFSLVGLGDRSVEESKERVRSAIKNSGADFPAKRITVNLAPADLPKNGPIFDLGIAVGILIASGQLVADVSDLMILGELSLDGSLSRTSGVLPLALLAKQLGLSRIIVPIENATEAAIIDGIEVYAIDNLKTVFEYLSGQTVLPPHPQVQIDFSLKDSDVNEYDFAQIKGQEAAKRALEIAAAGGHNALLKGPPGSGKTLLARSFPSILPPLSLEESLEVSQIYSIAGNLEPSQPLITVRPFRSPHHSASYVGMIGGGHHVKPGEVSMAHRGVLFMDELPEFNRQVLESLRQPLEDGQVTVSRAQSTLTFPAEVILLAAHNPCPCGYYQSTQKECSCTPTQINHYQKKLSGPLLDRIDLHVEVPAVDVGKLTNDTLSPNSAAVRERVIKARQIQTNRFEKASKVLTNAQMSNQQIRQFCNLTEEAKGLLTTAMTKMHLSARSYHRLLKVSRTIADLAESENIQVDHVAEALQYRGN